KSVIDPWLDPNATPYVRIESVTKQFGDFTAVNNVSLDIFERELFCLLGGSGCGKSTLLRMLAGFEDLTAGKIYIDGVDMAGIPPYERPVNMMFQSYALFPHMNVAQNVGFGLKQDKVSKPEIKERVDEMLNLVQLSQFAHRKPHQLSGGQRQRVALARSLVKHPKLLLLDEPLGALDKKLREETQFELVNIQESVGVTFVVVTHDQEEAMTLSSRIGVMDKGQIIQTGTPSEIYEYPNSRFVADFIGSVNMFAGRIVEDEPDHVIIETEEESRRIRVEHGISGIIGQQVWVAIRPEKIELRKERPEGDMNCFAGKVDEIAYLGNSSIFRVRLPSGKVVRITRPNIFRHTGDDLTWEDDVFLTWHGSSPVVLTS
ncbi:MAG: polyamine ABC transporter ATP-binding protein, partial [Rhodothermales bacterium]|nr:polyamine ABC transporter ATP-binding protein [Rhodothermales bacterium]